MLSGYSGCTNDYSEKGFCENRDVKDMGKGQKLRYFATCRTIHWATKDEIKTPITPKTLWLKLNERKR